MVLHAWLLVNTIRRCCDLSVRTVRCCFLLRSISQCFQSKSNEWWTCLGTAHINYFSSRIRSMASAMDDSWITWLLFRYNSAGSQEYVSGSTLSVLTWRPQIITIILLLFLQYILELNVTHTVSSWSFITVIDWREFRCRVVVFHLHFFVLRSRPSRTFEPQLVDGYIDVCVIQAIASAVLSCQICTSWMVPSEWRVVEVIPIWSLRSGDSFQLVCLVLNTYSS